MRLQKLADEDANGTIEFVLLAGLFVAPILTANQALTQINLRQVSLDSMAQTVSRDISLEGSSKNSETLLTQLSQDAGVNRRELQVEIYCEPHDICDKASSEVTVLLEYRNAKSIGKQLMNDTGSMMPLSLGLFSICLVFVLVGADLNAAVLFDQRTNQLARFLAQEHFADPLLAADNAVAQEASQLAKQFAFQGVEISQARLERPDGQTIRATICTRFDLPIHVFGLGSDSVACAESKMRLVP